MSFMNSYYFTSYKFFTLVLVGTLSLESELQQVSSRLQDSSQYSIHIYQTLRSGRIWHKVNF